MIHLRIFEMKDWNGIKTTPLLNILKLFDFLNKCKLSFKNLIHAHEGKCCYIKDIMKLYISNNEPHPFDILIINEATGRGKTKLNSYILNIKTVTIIEIS